LEELVTPKPIPLVISEIGVSIWVSLIDNVTHASEVFKIPNTTLKDTPIIVKPIGEQYVVDLIASVKHVVLGD